MIATDVLVNFFTASRLERRVTTGSRDQRSKGSKDIFVLHEVEPCVIDTRPFFRHDLSRLAHRRGGIFINGWPTDKQLDELCRRAGGISLHAVTMVEFLSDGFEPPQTDLTQL